MSALILAVDPGTEQSGVCLLGQQGVITSGVHSNHAVLEILQETKADVLAIEMIASYGMAVGKEVFATCRWIGRFQQAWARPDDVILIERRDVKLHLCGSARAKDPNIRQALIDLLGKPGTKREPGPTYGVSSHAWAALAVAVTARDSLAMRRAA